MKKMFQEKNGNKLMKEYKFNQALLLAFLVIGTQSFAANSSQITGKPDSRAIITPARPLNKGGNTVIVPSIKPLNKGGNTVIIPSIKPLNTSKESGVLVGKSILRDNRNNLTEFGALLDQMYANNPYSYGGQLSKESMDSFVESIMSNSSNIPDEGKYITSAQYLYSNIENKDVTGTNSYGSSSDMNGVIGTVEYGTRKNESVGFAIGGANQKLSMDKGTDLEGDIAYFGMFYKKGIDKLSFTTGLGYQLGSYDASRYLKNSSQNLKNEGSFDTNSYNAYGQVKYLLVENKGWKIEPKLKLSYTFVSQDSVEEDKAQLAMDIEKVEYNYFDTEVGVDFTKEAILESGKLRVITGLSYVNTQGSTEKDIDGRVKNASNFEIKGPSMAENSGKIGLGIEYERNSGMLYSIGSDFKFSSDDRKDTNVRVGIGYKF